MLKLSIIMRFTTRSMNNRVPQIDKIRRYNTPNFDLSVKKKKPHSLIQKLNDEVR